MKVLARRVDGADPLRLLTAPDPFAFAFSDRQERWITATGCVARRTSLAPPPGGGPVPGLDGHDGGVQMPALMSSTFTGAAPGGPWWGLPAQEVRLPRIACVDRDGATLLAVGADDHAAAAALDEGLRRLDAPASTDAPTLLTRREGPVPLTDLVPRALLAIRGGELEKVALARTRVLELSGSVRATWLLERLRAQRPSSYRFWCQWGDGRAFVGASPELLVRVDGDGVWTEALAGTSRRGADAAEDAALGAALVQSQKDHKEHDVVVEAILAGLRSLGLHPEAAPQAVRTLPYAMHLCTPIRAERGATLIDAVLALHPTPAVCGVPAGEARDRIVQWEGVPRGFYAGAIGVLWPDGTGEVSVAIRCALLDGARATLFAGAGVVEGSNPNAEEGEVVQKLQALEGLLHA